MRYAGAEDVGREGVESVIQADTGNWQKKIVKQYLVGVRGMGV